MKTLRFAVFSVFFVMLFCIFSTSSALAVIRTLSTKVVLGVEQLVLFRRDVC